MNDSISIVPKISSYPNNDAKAKEIVDWLVSQDIVKPTLSDCIWGDGHGYAISEGAKLIAAYPYGLPFGRYPNGLEITTKRSVFDAGANGMDECICPNCRQNISNEEWSFFVEWYSKKSDNITCPLCNIPNEIHLFSFLPDWGFSDLAFTFWGWGSFTDEFIEKFKQKLGCDIALVYRHV